ncbi:acidic mammalian chitinase-like, partial [Rhincodon typus]|uniref:acidic mammalian chitinase-like n=1 Tax=Rhincodon typus TaxID=259920 RepID=UPI002030D340
MSTINVFPVGCSITEYYVAHELRAAFTKEAKKTGSAKLLITAAVAAGKDKIDASYEVSKISKYLDFISVMTYDFHGHWDTVTGHNSPLYRSNVDKDVALDYNIDSVVKYWKDKGADAKKLLVGIPTYGRSFRLSSANSNVGAPASGPGPKGEYTKQDGFLANYEICDFLKGAEKHWIDEQKVPYAVKDGIWLGYDDQRSIDIKVEWIQENKFGGVLVWTLDFDDFSDHCKQGAYPILKILKKNFATNSGNRPANTTTTEDTVESLEAHFGCYSIPDFVIRKNDCQFTSEEFSCFELVELRELLPRRSQHRPPSEDMQ